MKLGKNRLFLSSNADMRPLWIFNSQTVQFWDFSVKERFVDIVDPDRLAVAIYFSEARLASYRFLKAKEVKFRR
ncbi:hypothetical protein RBK84_00395, partial [Pseudomonas aeruginosa]|uniref:hypothetical protein n=1 Tax=Pseudomonas aeruginosa TaxID=287 RepID=UPI0027D3C88A